MEDSGFHHRDRKQSCGSLGNNIQLAGWELTDLGSRAEDVAQLIEFLPTMHEVLGSLLNTQRQWDL